MNCTTTRVELGDRSYDICTGIGLVLRSRGGGAKLLRPFVKKRRVLVVMDENVDAKHGDTCVALLGSLTREGVSKVVLKPGEENKTLSAVEQICNAACKNMLDRGSVIVGIGGGVVGDLAAFAASVYMRGIDCIQIPTTLLAMVDSSVGGKTGADLPGGKNMIGTFYQPRLVLIDPLFIRTLTIDEIKNGMAELIKHAVLFDPYLFSELCNLAHTAFMPGFIERLEQLIIQSVRWKASVVARDEREHGRRRLLNLGHTFGHAIEKETHYTRYRHGEAIAIGMIAAANLSRLCHIDDKGTVEQISRLIASFGLPDKAKGLKPAQLLKAMYSDKKARNGRLCLILPHRIGICRAHTNIPEDLVLRALESICG